MSRAPFSLLILALIGCPAITRPTYDQVRDIDEDGGIAERFGGSDCVDDDPSISNCDADGDGYRTQAAGGDDCDDTDGDVHPEAQERCDGIDNDCDGLVDAEDPDSPVLIEVYVDADGDGYGDTDQASPSCPDAIPAGRVTTAGDCQDDDPQIHPNAVEFCDAVDSDCDGESNDFDANDAVGMRLEDADADGWSSGLGLGAGCVLEGMLAASDAPAELDCDDTDASTHPGATEVPYDGIDQACNGDADDNDADGDGVDQGADCDDMDAAVFPGAVEVCDGVDNNCDGTIDSADPMLQDPLFLYRRDQDADGFGDPQLVRGFCPSDDSTGWVVAGGLDDCDDSQPTVNPFAEERCDGLDNDCDGLVDDNAIDAITVYLDADGDGVGNAALARCGVTAGTSAFDGDCDDNDPAAYPGATEVCGDGVLQDCNTPDRLLDCDRDGEVEALLGGTDCDDARAEVLTGGIEICDGLDNDCDGLTDNDAQDALQVFVDQDGDGFGDTAVLACALVPGLAAVDGDCDDSSTSVFPGAFEVCGDGVLQDCDVPSGRFDCDGDGTDDENFGGTDCDDEDAAVSPGQLEICDAKDNDCDGLVDDDDPSVDQSTATTWYADVDEDGFGSPTVLALNTCTGPIGGVVNQDDCDDTDPLTGPGMPERCDLADNNCNGAIDEGNPIDAPTYYFDGDADGYGANLQSSTSSCDAPGPDWVLLGLDCDDLRADVHPGAVELCDGADNDCDGRQGDQDAGDGGLFTPLTWYRDNDNDGAGQPGDVRLQCAQPVDYVDNANDCDDNDGNIINFRTWYRDVDGDGFGDAADSVEQCGAPVGYVLLGSDCDDNSAQVSPVAPELCDGLDNDCDGLVDDDDQTVNPRLWFADLDGDGFGDVTATIQQCAPPQDYLPASGDCNDTDPTVFPGAAEVCDGIDNDCDGDADDADSNLSALDAWYFDGDGDGFGTGAAQFQCTAPAMHVAQGGDCVDTDNAILPGAPELCDGFDNDCDGVADAADADLVDGLALYIDADLDGLGGSTSFVACALSVGLSANTGDCDDNDPTIDVERLFSVDADGDAYGDPLAGGTLACFAPVGLFLATDCDDGDADSFPGAVELCDGLDNDCDGVTDADDPDVALPDTSYIDADNDGFGDAGLTVSTCGTPSPFVANADDCDDSNPAVNGPTVWARDADLDGYGNEDPMSWIDACVQPIGYVDDFSDCNDLGLFQIGAAYHPGAPEFCDGFDNDCDGLADDDDPDALRVAVYTDNDQDGYGDPNTFELRCSPGVGQVLNDQDCDDSGSPVGAGSYRWTGAPEYCDGLDNDCDGLLDGADPDSLIVQAGFGPWDLSEALWRVCPGATMQLSAGTHVLDTFFGVTPEFDRDVTIVGVVDITDDGIPNPATYDPTPILRTTIQSTARPVVDVLGGSRVQLRNLIIDGEALPGAGVRVIDGQLDLDGVVVQDSYGGGVVVSGSSVATVHDSELVNNRATSGGALAVLEGASVAVSSSSFYLNSAIQHGGAVFVRGSSLDLRRSFFDTNVAVAAGGALHAEYSNVTLADNEVMANMALDGGGLYAVESVLTDAGSTYLGNEGHTYAWSHATDSDLTFDAVWVDSQAGQGLLWQERGRLVIRGSEISQNEGSVQVVDADFDLFNTRVLQSEGLSPAIAVGNGTVFRMRNAVIAGAAVGLQLGPGARAGNITQSDFVYNGVGVEVLTARAPMATYNILWNPNGIDQTGGFPMANNLFLDPGYVSFDGGFSNYRAARFWLHPTSLAVDVNTMVLDTDGSVGDSGSTGGPFGNTGLQVRDSDGDGMDDAWELTYCGAPTACDPAADIDLSIAGTPSPDGLTNLQEYVASTNPLIDNTDGDARIDGLDSAPLDPSMF